MVSVGVVSKKYGNYRRMAHLFLAIILFIPSLVIGGGVTSAASGWSIIDGYGATGINVNPAMRGEKPAIVEWNGEIYVAWRETIQSTPTINQIRVKKFNGSNWVSVDGGHPTLGLNYDVTKDVVSPTLAVYNNALYLSWSEMKTSSIGQIRVKKYDGTSWTNAEGGSVEGINGSPSISASTPKLTEYNNELYAIWTEAAKIRAKKYNGTTWTSLDGGGADGLNVSPGSGAGSPVIAVYGNDLYALWSERVSTGFSTVRAKKYDGNNWTVVDGGAGLNKVSWNNAITPVLSVIDDHLYVAWVEARGGQYSTDDQIRVKKFDGSTWTNIDGDGEYGINVNIGMRAFEVQLASLNNELYAIWSEYSGVTSNAIPIFKIRVKKYDGNGWVLAENGRNGGLNAFGTKTASNPAITAMNGALYAVWDENDRAVVNIRAAQFSPPPPPSVTSVSVSPITTSIMQGGSRQLSAVVNAVGDAPTTVTWNSSDVTNKVAVNATGLVTVARDATPGNYIITATSAFDSTKTATSTVTVTYAPAVQSITVSPSTDSLMQGESIQLTATVVAVGGAPDTVRWHSSDLSNKVTVDATGKVSVASDATPGDYTITASSTYDTFKRESAVITVTYAPAVNSVSVSPDTDSLMQGESRQLVATVNAVGGAGATVTWNSSDTDNKVEVSDTGFVTVAADAVPGNYTITATSTVDSSKVGTATITVTYAPAVNGVSVTPDPASIVQGDGIQLEAIVEAVGGASTEVTWNSSDLTGKVEVSDTGFVTAAADAVPGDYTITATSIEDGSKIGMATVTVTYAPAIHNITVNPESANVAQGRSEQLTATVTAVGGADPSVMWASNDSSNKVTVSSMGNVSVASDAVPGDYVITATSVYDLTKVATANIKVTYAPAVNSVRVNPATDSLMQGESRQLTATVDTVGGADITVTWSSSDATNKVKVNDTGYVTVEADAEPGEYTIFATSTVDISKKGSMILTVTAAPTYTIASIEDRTLEPLLLDYESGTQETNTVSIQHTGTGNLVHLSASLSGNDSDAFVITQPDTELTAGDQTEFTLRAKDGLPAGTYTATVTLTADQMLPVTFKVTQAVNLPNAPANPRNLTAEPGDGHVTLKWETEPEVEYRIYMATDDDPDYKVEITDEASSPYTIPELVNGKTYYFVVKAENKGGLSEASNQVSVTPSSVPGAPTDVTATPGNGQATVRFTAPAHNGGSTITGYEVTVSPGNTIITGNTSPITVPGLNNGTSYTFNVRAINSAGRSTDSAMSNAVVPVASSAPSTTPPVAQAPTTTPATPASTGVDILVNGKVENAGQAVISQRNQQTALTIVIDQQKLNDRLKKEGQHAVVTIPINQTSDIFVGELNGEMIKTMEDYQAVLEFKTEQASYTVPAGQIRIGEIAAQVGGSANLQEMKVRIEISATTSVEQEIVERAAMQGELVLVAQPLNFTVNVVHGDKTFQVKNFDAYVERTITIPDGVDPDKITTGVVVEPDGSVRHVPTKVRQNNGRYEAQINSLTNSTYAVVWHPLQFNDVTNHWGKDAVNDMGSRMIVEGVGNGNFSPDRAVTRAEFATIVVRGLGLRPENKDTPFSDVQAEQWFSGAIHAAQAYGLINGFEDGTFRPDDTITREQAMVILAQAMKITGLQGTLNDASLDATLQRFQDDATVSSWARSGAADSVRSGLVQGRSESLLVPKGKITRAEIATMMQRLLQKSNLI
ncbi:Ig-like domain-containing protein [Paenibacillus amylolyticus]|uniref:Cell wall/surface repeat protein n=1 Tax=Paenibacillus amylolyticus TaxID=1451 RepID=A0A100VPM7_PAEAM|nr:Ig-like domain-containing protein [Paenibacillus amylolyticus]GAS83738.1 cell wall/surface repeat protein [Paenibacillus amylolyticus]